MSVKAAYHTLGCKVNQYDTQAMRELMERAGYQSVSFQEEADVYVLNTCTVTGTGDRKSLQLSRRIRRDHPNALLVLCGCLAQKKGEALLREAEADLIIGTQMRGRIVELVDQVRQNGSPLCAVSPFPPAMPFESLNISRSPGIPGPPSRFRRAAITAVPTALFPLSGGPSVPVPWRI